MKYQIIHEDDKHFKIHNPKDGSHFVVAKNGLSKDFIEKAQKLCGGGPVKMSEGGEVPSALSLDEPAMDIAAVPTAFTPTQTPSAEPAIAPGAFDLNSVIPKPVEGDGMAPLAAPAQTSEMPIQPSQGQQPQGAQVSQVPNGDYLDQAISTEKNSLMNIAGAKLQEGKTNEKTLDNLAQQQAQAHADLVKAHDEVEAENAPLRKSILETKVDPNRLWHNASTGNKVMASIGLILGGIGAGLTKGPNAALDVMQKNIDRDIQAQKDDLGKKQTLYSMNLDKYKNADAAYAATMLNYGTTAKTMIERAAAKSGSQQAIAQGQAAGAQIDLHMAPLKLELAIKKISMQNADPVGRQIRIFIPEKHQEAAIKELTEAKEHNVLRSDSLSAFDEVANMKGYGILSPNDAAAAKNTFMGKMIKVLEGRYNHEAAENLAEAVWPKKTDFASTVENKRRRLNALLGGPPKTDLLNSYGIKPDLGGQFDLQGNKRFTEGKPKL